MSICTFADVEHAVERALALANEPKINRFELKAELKRAHELAIYLHDQWHEAEADAEAEVGS